MNFSAMMEKGKDVIIIDDMISSGESMLDVAKRLKERGAGRVLSAQRLVFSPTGWRNSMNITKKATSAKS